MCSRVDTECHRLPDVATGARVAQNRLALPAPLPVPWDEVIKAYVKLRDGAEMKASELREFLKDKLAPFELPRKVEFRDQIPKTFIGKPSRKTLIEEERRKAETAKSESVDA